MKRMVVAALFFGDYPDYAERCLDSLAVLPEDIHYLLGGNALGMRTYRLLHHFQASRPGRVELDISNHNRLKYPLLRTWRRTGKLDAEFMMWFDDDSALALKNPQDGAAWLETLESKLTDHELVGAGYYISIAPSRRDWIASQSWNRNRPYLSRFYFPTGGWWTTRPGLFTTLDWPPPLWFHTGGDVILGMILHQQGLSFLDWHDQVMINRSLDAGAKDSSAPRRGVGARNGFAYPIEKGVPYHD